MAWRRWLQLGLGGIFEYDTPRIVHIRSKKIGALSRLLQLAVVGYITGWVMIYNKASSKYHIYVHVRFTFLKDSKIKNTIPSMHSLILTGDICPTGGQGYQERDQVVSAVSAKLKGSLLTNFT